MIIKKWCFTTHTRRAIHLQFVCIIFVFIIIISTRTEEKKRFIKKASQKEHDEEKKIIKTFEINVLLINWIERDGQPNKTKHNTISIY